MRSILSTLFVFFLFTCAYSAEAENQVVWAGWYGSKFEGKIMKNGREFKANDPTIAAHRTLPMGTKLLVRNPVNGRKLVVVVKDRGPFIKGRDLDLSYAAAKHLGYITKGVALLHMSVSHNP